MCNLLIRTSIVIIAITASISVAQKPSPHGRSAPGEHSVESWIKRLGAEAPKSRRQAARALGQLGPVAEAAVPALIMRMEDLDTGVQIAAVDALGSIGEGARAAVPALITKLATRS
jgi:HEAT repeat protein